MGFPLGGLSTSAGRAAFIVTIVSMVLVSLGLVLRIWATVRVSRGFKVHDYFYYPGYIFAIAYSAQFLYGIYPNVIGMHIEDAKLYPDRLQTVLKVG